MADKYEKVAKVGEGSFGVVWKVKHKLTGEHFAIKKIRLQSPAHGVSMAAIDEINALQVSDGACCSAICAAVSMEKAEKAARLRSPGKPR